MIGTMMAKARQGNRDWWIPWSFVAFFLVVLLANGTMLFFALNSWTGIGTADAYRKGLAYNQQLDEVEEQARRGWRAELAFEGGTGLSGRLVFVLGDRHEVPLEGALVAVELVRPTHEGQDFSLVLTPEGNGRYATAVVFPLAGLWEARLTAAHEKGTYQLRKRLVIRR